MNKIYIAGPMQGIKDFNFPAFHDAAETWRVRGWEVFSPAERDIEAHGEAVANAPTGQLEEIKDTGFNLREALAADAQWIAREADAIFMLSGWENSKGAQAEWALARALGLDIFYQDPNYWHDHG
jgi:hypothetical protein